MNQEQKDADLATKLTAAARSLGNAQEGLDLAYEALDAAQAALNTPVDPPAPPPPPAPPGPDGTAFFAADYEGNIAPWNGIDFDPTTGGPKLAATSRNGKPVARAYLPAQGRRAELSGAGNVEAVRRYTTGETVYLGFSVLYPAAFPKSQVNYHTNMQVHTSKRGLAGKSSALGLDAANDAITLRGSSYATPSLSRKYTEPLRREVWLHAVIRLTAWAGSGGTWEAWLRWDDESEYRHVVLPGALDVLVDSTDFAYWKLGIYRSSANLDEVEVFHAKARAGDTFQAVQR